MDITHPPDPKDHHCHPRDLQRFGVSQRGPAYFLTLGGPKNTNIKVLKQNYSIEYSENNSHQQNKSILKAIMLLVPQSKEKPTLAFNSFLRSAIFILLKSVSDMIEILFISGRKINIIKGENSKDISFSQFVGGRHFLQSIFIVFLPDFAHAHIAGKKELVFSRKKPVIKIINFRLIKRTALKHFTNNCVFLQATKNGIDI